jgi:Protein of unknown function (DUF3267).
MIDFDNYRQEKKTIDIVQANAVALVIFSLTLVLFAIPFVIIWGIPTLKIFPSLAKFFIIFLIGIITHELIHGLIFGLFAKNGFRSIRFGVMWKMLTPYCHCKEPLKIKHYFIGALMPALVLGLVPAVISLFNGNVKWLIFGILFIAAAAGDFMVVWILRKENRENYVQDHPSEAGCYVFRRKEE